MRHYGKSVRHYHQALAREDGGLATHGIALREPPPLTLDQVTAGGATWACEEPYCFALQFLAAGVGNAVTLIHNAQSEGKR